MSRVLDTQRGAKHPCIMGLFSPICMEHLACLRDHVNLLTLSGSQQLIGLDVPGLSNLKLASHQLRKHCCHVNLCEAFVDTVCEIEQGSVFKLVNTAPVDCVTSGLRGDCTADPEVNSIGEVLLVDFLCHVNCCRWG